MNEERERTKEKQQKVGENRRTVRYSSLKVNSQQTKPVSLVLSCSLYPLDASTNLTRVSYVLWVSLFS